MNSNFCLNCGNEIFGAHFCGKCGYTVASFTPPSNFAPIQNLVHQKDTMEINIVCPKCESQNVFLANSSNSTNSFVCPKCRTSFLSRIVNIRSKSSRGSKKENRRTFSVRVKEFNGREDLIEFINAGYDDFELRARDLAVFSYINNNLIIAQNLTVGQFKKISKPSCYIASYVYGSDAIEVHLLRKFRDDYLLDSYILSQLVKTYYFFSKKIVALIKDNRICKNLFYFLLFPITSIIKSIYEFKE